MRQQWFVIILVGSVMLQLGWGGVVYAKPPAQLAEADLGAYIAAHPGALATWQDGDETAASVIQMTSDVYAVSPRIMLALLESTNEFLSAASVPDAAWEYPITKDPDVPSGFAAQLEWTAAMLRAGMGPYDEAPVLTFTDGMTYTVNLNQAPEGIAVQRLLAVGHTAREWHELTTRFVAIFADYFDGEIVMPTVVTPSAPPDTGFLQRPWPAGVRVRHLAYFDHAYPTVDAQAHDNGYVVTYLGRQDVQYDGHDGHDYAFPDQLIGTPILAAADGVAYASTRRGNGVYILHADGYTTVYWHLDKFSRRFKGLLNSGVGVPVQAGDVLGSSGQSGFVIGTPHLHFEVRHYGKQVDPYGWYGDSADPCLTHPLCAESQWLWDASLAGEYDFTPPNQLAELVQAPEYALDVATPAEYQFVAAFDKSLNPDVAHEPTRFTAMPYVDASRGVVLRDGASLQLAAADGFRMPVGAWSLWVNVDTLRERRTYLMAASATADEQQAYAGTMAVRIVQTGDQRTCEFWSVDDDGRQSDILAVPMSDMGWQHVTVAWHQDTGTKRIAINGIVVAQRSGVQLPTAVGESVYVGRFPFGVHMPLHVDDVVVWNRIPSEQQIRERLLNPAGMVLSEAVHAGASVPVHIFPLVQGDDPVLSMRMRVADTWQDPVPFVGDTSIRMPVDCVDEVRTVAVELYTRNGLAQTLTQSVYCAP